MRTTMTAQQQHPYGAGRSGMQPGYKRVVLASCFGTAIEWYDFFIYGFLGPLVFDLLFFPKLDPLIGTIAVFATFSVGFLARPLGGIVFGHFGDRIGRKSILMVTLLRCGVAILWGCVFERRSEKRLRRSRSDAGPDNRQEVVSKIRE